MGVFGTLEQFPSLSGTPAANRRCELGEGATAGELNWGLQCSLDCNGTCAVSLFVCRHFLSCQGCGMYWAPQQRKCEMYRAMGIVCLTLVELS